MKNEEGPLHRQLTGISKLYADIIFALIPMVGIIGIINLPSYLGISLHLQQYIGLIFGLVIASCFVITPAKRGLSIDKLPWYDFLFSLISIVTGLYIAINYKTIVCGHRSNHAGKGDPWNLCRLVDSGSITEGGRSALYRNHPLLHSLRAFRLPFSRRVAHPEHLLSEPCDLFVP